MGWAPWSGGGGGVTPPPLLMHPCGRGPFSLLGGEDTREGEGTTAPIQSPPGNNDNHPEASMVHHF